MKKKIVISLFIISLIVMVVQTGYGQFRSLLPQNRLKNSAIWDLSYSNGFLINNESASGGKFTDDAGYNGFRFQVGFRKNNLSDLYNQLYRLPVFGIGWESDIFHDKAIGNIHSLYFYYSIPVIFEQSSRFSFSYTGSLGISYNQNQNDWYDNPLALMIGAYGNSILHTGVNIDYHPNPFWVIYASLRVKCLSNGSLSQPQNGLALFPITVGLKYKPTGFFTDKKDKSLPKFIKYNMFNVGLSAGSRNVLPGEANFLSSAFEVNWMRMFSYKIRAGAGAELYYVTGSKTRSPDGKSGFSTAFSYAGLAVAEWVLSSRLSVPLAFGYYIGRNEFNGEEKPYFERVGLKYYLGNRIYTGINIKAHGIRTDNFQITVGYTFRKDENRY